MAESIPAVELEAVTRRYGDVIAVDNVTLSIAEGEFFSLLGPSGCGKTTTLRVIAGFEMPTSGSVRIRGQEMGDTPPFKRPVNTVFQSYALFPHMTVAQNVAFGLEMKKVPGDEIKRRVAEALEMVQLPQMAHRKPRQLSGGQRQRIALARALVNRPQVLLLDEPLGALDLKLRKAMQLELKALQEQVGITFVYVTHDQEEALTMSDRIAIINQGRVYQVGSPLEIYERPASRFVADFIGETNFLEGQVETVTDGQVVIMVDGAVRVSALSGRPVSPGQAVSVAVRPEKISLQRAGDALSLSKGGIRGRIEELVYIGTDTRYVVRLTDRARLTVRTQNVSARNVEQFHQGEEVGLSWDADSALVLVD